MGSGATKASSLQPQSMPISNVNSSSISQGNKNRYLATTIPNIVVSAKKLAAARKKEKEQEKRRLIAEYPELGDALDCVHEWMKEMENEKEADLARKNMGLRTKKWLEEIYVMYFDNEPSEHKRVIAEQIVQDRGGQIFTEYMKVLTEDAKNTPIESGHKFDSLELLRNVCWNYSDSSFEFCTDLGRAGMFLLLVTDLVTLKEKITDGFVTRGILLPSLSIIHNCAKVPDNKKYLKEAKTVKAVIPYSKVDAPEIKMIAMMTLAYIIDEKDNELISTDGSVIKFMLSYLNGAITSHDHKYEGFSAEEIAAGLMHLAKHDKNKVIIVNEGALPALLQLMEKGSDAEKAVGAKTVWVLSFSTENKETIRNEKNMMKTLQLLSRTPGTAKESASGALWVLDDEERVRKIRLAIAQQQQKQQQQQQQPRELSLSLPAKSMKKSRVPNMAMLEEKSKVSHSSHITTISGISKKSLPFPSDDQLSLDSDPDDSFEEMLEQQAEGEEEEEEEDDDDENARGEKSDVQQLVQEGPSSPKHIMISYQWDCQKLVIRVKEKLEGQHYRIWIDVESMGGSTLQAMAEAVENSDAVLLCMSQKYKESPNCRTEAEYAYKLGKMLIPLRVEANYQPDGWLGALQGAKLYFDFSNLMHFDNTTSKLIKEIGNRGKIESFDQPDAPISPPATVHPTFTPPALILPPIRTEKAPVEIWTKDEVEKWASTNHITSRKIMNLDGESLIFLHSLKSTAPEFFFKYISDRMGVIELRDIMNLSKGLDSLEISP